MSEGTVELTFACFEQAPDVDVFCFEFNADLTVFNADLHSGACQYVFFELNMELRETFFINPNHDSLD